MGIPCIFSSCLGGFVLNKPSMTLEEEIHSLGQRAKAASRILATASTEQKNAALLAMADAVLAASDTILAANRDDLAAATQNDLSAAMIDRLRLDPARLKKSPAAFAKWQLCTIPREPRSANGPAPTAFAFAKCACPSA